MSIDKDKIKHVAKLARISLDEKKTDSLTEDLSSIFKFIEKLNELNTKNIEPLTSILNEPLRSRSDEINDGKIKDQILKNSPKKNEEFFIVPKVVEQMTDITKKSLVQIVKAIKGKEISSTEVTAAFIKNIEKI